jgi:predicted Zn-dependent peptidase
VHLALNVMTAILGGGMASRFFSDLHDKQVSVYPTGPSTPRRVDTSGFEEVTVARAYVVGIQALDRRTNARRAWYLAAAELAGVGYEFVDIHAAKVRKVPPADVQRVARQYLGVLRTVIIQPQ